VYLLDSHFRFNHGLPFGVGSQTWGVFRITLRAGFNVFQVVSRLTPNLKRACFRPCKPPRFDILPESSVTSHDTVNIRIYALQIYDMPYKWEILDRQSPLQRRWTIRSFCGIQSGGQELNCLPGFRGYGPDRPRPTILAGPTVQDPPSSAPPSSAAPPSSSVTPLSAPRLSAPR